MKHDWKQILLHCWTAWQEVNLNGCLQFSGVKFSTQLNLNIIQVIKLVFYDDHHFKICHKTFNLIIPPGSEDQFVLRALEELL